MPGTTSGTPHPDPLPRGNSSLSLGEGEGRGEGGLVFDSREGARYRARAAHQNTGRERPQRGGSMINRFRWTALALALAASLVPAAGGALAQGTIKVAYTDPLSGPFAQVGDQNLQQLKYIIDWINGRGGALGKKFELVAFDNKSQPSDALLALKSATDQNMPIIMQCSGSNIAAALIEAVDKHNERNPDNRIIYVN